MGLFNGNVLGVTGCGDRHAGHGCVGYDYMKLANQSGVFRGSYFDDLQLLSLRDSILFFVHNCNDLIVIIIGTCVRLFKGYTVALADFEVIENKHLVGKRLFAIGSLTFLIFLILYDAIFDVIKPDRVLMTN